MRLAFYISLLFVGIFAFLLILQNAFAHSGADHPDCPYRYTLAVRQTLTHWDGCSTEPAGTNHHVCCDPGESTSGSCQANGTWSGGTCGSGGGSYSGTPGGTGGTADTPPNPPVRACPANTGTYTDEGTTTANDYGTRRLILRSGAKYAKSAGPWYYNEVLIEDGATLCVSSSLEIKANSITINGVIDAEGRGNLGGAGGKGGGGGNGGAASPFAHFSNGGLGISGSSGAGGTGTYGGTGGSLSYSGGGGGGGGDCRTPYWQCSGMTAGSGGGEGAGGSTAPGTGGYMVTGGNGDASTDESLVSGSGGGGGGGGAGGGGGGGASCIEAGSGGGGGAGGYGGYGGNGGGFVKLYSRTTISMVSTGLIITKGTIPSGAQTGKNGAGGVGGGGGGGGTGGSNGAGGGIALYGKLSLGGALNAKGGSNITANGGTIKLFSMDPCIQLNTSQVFGGRTYCKNLSPEPFNLDTTQAGLKTDCSAQGVSYIDLSWQSSTNATCYEVYRKESAAADTSYQLVSQPCVFNTSNQVSQGITATTFRDGAPSATRVQLNTSYTYFIRAKNTATNPAVDSTNRATIQTRQYCDLTAPSVVLLPGAENCDSTTNTISNRCYSPTGSGSKQWPCNIKITATDTNSPIGNVYYKLQRNPTAGPCYNSSSGVFATANCSTDNLATFSATSTYNFSIPASVFGSPPLSFPDNQYRLSARATNGDGITSAYTPPVDFTIAPVCLDPWLKTTGGDVHSNIKINTPGGP